MQIGIDSFAAAISDAVTGLTLSPVERVHHLPEEIELKVLLSRLDEFVPRASNKTR
jgi:hypothetical protein